MAFITLRGTCVPPGPSKKTNGLPPASVCDNAGKFDRISFKLKIGGCIFIPFCLAKPFRVLHRQGAYTVCHKFSDQADFLKPVRLDGQDRMRSFSHGHNRQYSIGVYQGNLRQLTQETGPSILFPNSYNTGFASLWPCTWPCPLF